MCVEKANKWTKTERQNNLCILIMLQKLFQVFLTPYRLFLSSSHICVAFSFVFEDICCDVSKLRQMTIWVHFFWYEVTWSGKIVNLTFCDSTKRKRQTVKMKASFRSEQKTVKIPPILKAIQNILYLSTCDTQNFDVVSAVFSSVFVVSVFRWSLERKRNFSMNILSSHPPEKQKNHPRWASKYLCRDVLFWGNTVVSMR